MRRPAGILLRLFLSVSIVLCVCAPARAQDELQPQPWIRVAVVTGARSVVVRSTGGCRLHDLGTSEPLASYENAHTFTFERSRDAVRLAGHGESGTGGFSVVCADEGGRLEINGRLYRRMVRIVEWEGALVCVNVLPLEEYLWGVVPCEVPPPWPREALRAQAVAARTYSLRALEQYPDRPFDVYSSVTDQVYRGSGRERDSTTEACRDTLGEVCCHNGTPIIAYFHAASGGWTASGAEMFGRDLPYLRAVNSRDAGVYRWTFRITHGELASALRRGGRDVGTIQRAWVHRFSPEGRAEQVKIIHSRGVLLVTGAELRRILGQGNIESTYFTLEGQSSPEIPEAEVEQVRTPPRTSESLLEWYASANPGVLAPISAPAQLRDCWVLSSGDVRPLGRFSVIGADSSREYLGGFVWVAWPVRSGTLQDLQGIGEEEFVDESVSRTGGIVVDDPGSGVGTPRDGGFVFVGHGCGHGVGMSQHGARILAESGWDYNRILRYFYSGIEIMRYW